MVNREGHRCHRPIPILARRRPHSARCSDDYTFAISISQRYKQGQFLGGWNG